MSSGRTVPAIKTPLNDTASVAVSRNILYTRGNRVEDELGVLVWELEEYALDGVIAVGVDTEPGCRGLERVCQDLGGRVLLLLALLGLGGLSGRGIFLLVLRLFLRGLGGLGTLLLFALLLVHGAHLHNLLNAPGAVQVQAGVHQTRAHAADQGDSFLRGDPLQNLLEQVVPKGVHHGLSPERQAFVQDGRGRAGPILIQRLLEKTTAYLVP
mmetsp:Transcript_54735/g.116305  ORF Transcript_54735/g.116305 Transcript_54735/m.116305 type:complete len:212 (+) Transcript_54735:1246-1881(+)